MSQFIKALGIMNGTSVDAIDYTLIKVHKQTLRPSFIAHQQQSIPKSLKSQILLAATDQLTTYDLSRLNFTLGKLYETQVKKLAKSWRWEVIGLHGQTVHHEGGRATLQIGTPAYLATGFSAPVVAHFRELDVASGGQGAPFAPFFQKFLLAKSRKCTAFHNLGGISNLTLFSNHKVMAFDTGPANILMDAWLRKASKGKKHYDNGGRLAARGLYEPKVLKRFLQYKFFTQRPPKSCGREEFNLAFIEKYGGTEFKRLRLEDQLATLCELSAVTLTAAYKTLLNTMPAQIYFYGGGINNKFLLHRIQYHLPTIALLTTDDLGWPTQAFEAAIFGFLAAARLLEKPVHLPTVTGAKRVQQLGFL